MDWLADDNKQSFRIKYTRAREVQADFHAEQIIEIADELTVEAKYNGEDVTLDISSTAVARNKLRVEARKWYAAKLAPKKYGEKVTNEHTGTDGAPISHSLSVTFVSPACG